MATFTETKATLDEIAVRSEANRKRLENARTQIAQAEADLLAMQTAYSAFATQLDADAAANPADDAWQTALAEKDQMQSDFIALKNRSTALLAAYDAV